jgi:hypothetical protein
MSTTTTTPASSPSILSTFENDFQVAENDIVTWINQAWLEVEAVESWVDNELVTISGWIAANLTTIDSVFSTAAALVPAAAPEIAAAEAALAAAGAASSILGAGLKAGSTPASTISNAYTAVTAASTAVNALLAVAAKPTAATSSSTAAS